MKVILLQNVKKLGKAGEIKNVSDGYALNFLIPSKKVAPANEKNIEAVKVQKDKKEVKISKIREVANFLRGKKITIKKEASEKGKLFAGVNEDEVYVAVKEKLGKNIDRASFIFKDHIKELGIYDSEVRVNKERVAIKIEIINI